MAALVPLLVLSIFRGADVLIHGHQGESTHLHLAPFGVEGETIAAANAHDQAHGHSHADDRGNPDEGVDDSPLGVQLTIQDHEQIPSRETDVVPDMDAGAHLALAEWTVALLSDASLGSPERPPSQICDAMRPSPRFGDRLARTSNAFLI